MAIPIDNLDEEISRLNERLKKLEEEKNQAVIQLSLENQADAIAKQHEIEELEKKIRELRRQKAQFSLQKSDDVIVPDKLMAENTQAVMSSSQQSSSEVTVSVSKTRTTTQSRSSFSETEQQNLALKLEALQAALLGSDAEAGKNQQKPASLAQESSSPKPPEAIIRVQVESVSAKAPSAAQSQDLTIKESRKETIKEKADQAASETAKEKKPAVIQKAKPTQKIASKDKRRIQSKTQRPKPKKQPTMATPAKKTAAQEPATPTLRMQKLERYAHELAKHKEHISKVTERLSRIENKKNNATLKTSVAFRNSLSRLNNNIEKMLAFMETASQNLKNKQANDPTQEKLDRLIDQNEKIAAAILAIADMIQDKRDTATNQDETETHTMTTITKRQDDASAAYLGTAAATGSSQQPDREQMISAQQQKPALNIGPYPDVPPVSPGDSKPQPDDRRSDGFGQMPFMHRESSTLPKDDDMKIDRLPLKQERREHIASAGEQFSGMDNIPAITSRPPGFGDSFTGKSYGLSKEPVRQNTAPPPFGFDTRKKKDSNFGF